MTENVCKHIRIWQIKMKQGDRDDAREIIAFCTYFRENQVEQLALFKEDLKREIISFVVKISFRRIS